MSRKPNFDVNVDGRTDERTNGRTEIWTPISHPAISRCDKNHATYRILVNTFVFQYTKIKSCKCPPDMICLYQLQDKVHDSRDLQRVQLTKGSLRLTIICGTERNETEQCLGCKRQSASTIL